jgi:hypothetical protein
MNEFFDETEIDERERSDSCTEPLLICRAMVLFGAIAR